MSDPVVSSSRHPRFVRRRGWLDPFIAEADVALQVLAGGTTASRANPAGPFQADDSRTLDEVQKKHAAGLMRINHVGEVCAQALYRGQAAVCRDSATVDLLHQAATEEIDHLAWCGQRLKELHSHPSVLNPLWYAGSFALGLLAGRAGVSRSLGFMAETERQVEAHLDAHLTALPLEDVRSRQIVEQMKIDESGHRMTAEAHGASELPAPVKTLMTLMSKIMTTAAYRL